MNFHSLSKYLGTSARYHAPVLMASAVLFVLPLYVASAAPPVHAGKAPAAQQIRIPPPGSSERKQILDALRPSPGSKIRFIVHQLKVIDGQTATFAYAVVDPSRQEYDGGEYLLQKSGGWRVIWSVTGGGTDDCRTAAAYFQSALRLLTAAGIDPDLVTPQLHEEYLRLATFAAEDPDCTALGDLGPELPVIPTDGTASR